MDAGKANFGTFATGLVEPQTRTTHQLAEGHYSLSTLSTVPYVSLVGHAQTEKIFSWGEVVYVPDGVAVTIKNASYHKGDIVLNGGRDFSTLPQRVTVPVTVQAVPDPEAEEFFFLIPDWKVDTRRARRAWIAINLSTFEGQDQNAILTAGRIEGSKGGHSHATGPLVTGPVPAVLQPLFGTGSMVGYINNIFLPAATAQGVFPLGDLANTVPATIAHALLDTGFFAARIELEEPPPSPLQAYYILEY
jgi:hypothetical protein